MLASFFTNDFSIRNVLNIKYINKYPDASGWGIISFTRKAIWVNAKLWWDGEYQANNLENSPERSNLFSNRLNINPKRFNLISISKPQYLILFPYLIHLSIALVLQ
ncbi:MAG: hypothetical protein WC679_13570 [Bacteroidales bacterium]|jgi:hypothetical protein